MSVEDIAMAIRKVRRHLRVFQLAPPGGPVNLAAPANNDEWSTRYIIIDPVLRSLGWDLVDPDQCEVQHRTRVRGYGAPIADYALRNSRGCPVIVIEAKRLRVSSRNVPGYPYRGERQREWDEGRGSLRGYLRDVSTASIGVLTSGQEWEFYLRRGAEWPQERGVFRLSQRNLTGVAQRLHTHLAREHYW